MAPKPESLAAIAARSMCPTCDGRAPEPGEEAYATCFFCAFTEASIKPAQPATPSRPVRPSAA